VSRTSESKAGTCRCSVLTSSPRRQARPPGALADTLRHAVVTARASVGQLSQRYCVQRSFALVRLRQLSPRGPLCLPEMPHVGLLLQELTLRSRSTVVARTPTQRRGGDGRMLVSGWPQSRGSEPSVWPFGLAWPKPRLGVSKEYRNAQTKLGRSAGGDAEVLSGH